MKTLIAIALVLSGFGLACCDPLTDKYFSKLLNLKSVTIARTCEDNPTVVSDGDFFEVYSISKETLLQFEEHFGVGDSATFVIEGDYEPIAKFRHRRIWRRTLSDTETSSILITSISQINEAPKCFSKDQLRELLSSKGNYYALFYNSWGREIGMIQFFILDASGLKIYIVKLAN